ncbi:MAG TPA: 16S rRNA (cytosine(967)-C(5))-methyltransferase RsmB [Gemmatimonadaceae bacterium]|nr:16S rRNA (cytosine(967)-C(5))-methyltransferase RsmB [Gemmatimonadaceae bacterium]
MAPQHPTDNTSATTLSALPPQAHAGGVRSPSGRASVATDARVVAADVFADLRRGELLDATFSRRTTALDARDRRWTRELVYGTLRTRGRLDALLAARVRGGLGRLDADLLDLLRLGTYQLLEMGSVPAYAAIAQTVELAKARSGEGAGKLANAVLRRLDRERADLALPAAADLADALATELSHPRWLVARWLERWGPDETRRLLEANNVEPPIVARPVHVVREQLEASLEEAGAHTADAPLVPDSLVLVPPVPALTELGAFKRGLFHIQDPAATLVTKYAAIAPGSLVVDLCAAPGGKAIELSRTAGAVFACDVSAHRLGRLRESVARLELGNVFAFVADARRPATQPVDVVLLDAPCTGTGTMRRHPDARWRLKPSDLGVMTTLQWMLLSAAADSVKPGGLLVYSTCSIEPEENDAPIDRFLAERPEWALEPPPDGVVPAEVLDAGRLRVLPQRHGADGAFAARLRRRA